MTVPLTSKTPKRVDLSPAWATTRILAPLGRGVSTSYNWHMSLALRDRLNAAVKATKSKTLAELLVHIVTSWLDAHGF